MKVYTIYEIPGVKIGCDCDWPTRAHEQGVNPEDCIVLQQETDVIQVSIDEIWWQIEKDYPVDKVPYFIVVEHNRKRASSGGKVAGPLSVKNKTGIHGMSEEDKFNSNSKGGKSSGNNKVKNGTWKLYRIDGGDATRGKIWINNGEKTKRIIPERLQEFISQGWFEGRGPRR